MFVPNPTREYTAHLSNAQIRLILLLNARLAVRARPPEQLLEHGLGHAQHVGHLALDPSGPVRHPACRPWRALPLRAPPEAAPPARSPALPATGLPGRWR
jgi:hypothetical protein